MALISDFEPKTRQYVLIFGLFLSSIGFGQALWKEKSTEVRFFAGTPLEDIEAKNKTTRILLNENTGEVYVLIKIKDFVFRRALMQEHFNENYLESDKYPVAEWKGRLDPALIPVSEFVGQKWKCSGLLTLHGVGKERTLEVELSKKGESIRGKSNFEIILSEHNIDRPSIVWEKLAEKVAVEIDFELIPKK